MTGVFILWEFRLECGDSLGTALESIKLRTSLGDRCLTTFGDNSQCIVCTDVDGHCLCRVLGIECVSEGILSLFSECVWSNANRMLDTKLGSVFLVDKF
jgi:hypothetical protein